MTTKLQTTKKVGWYPTFKGFGPRVCICIINLLLAFSVRYASLLATICIGKNIRLRVEGPLSLQFTLLSLVYTCYCLLLMVVGCKQILMISPDSFKQEEVVLPLLLWGGSIIAGHSSSFELLRSLPTQSLSWMKVHVPCTARCVLYTCSPCYIPTPLQRLMPLSLVYTCYGLLLMVIGWKQILMISSDSLKQEEVVLPLLFPSTPLKNLEEE